MATLETQQLDEIILTNRRKMLALGGAVIAGLAFSGLNAQAQSTPAYTDADILNFALNLEYLEAQFYTLATQGKTIDQAGVGIGTGTATASGAGTVTTKSGGPAACLVPWTLPVVQSYAVETAQEERNHVIFLRNALSGSAVAMPNIDLYNSFNTLAAAAGLGSSFDPFQNDITFLAGAYIFEDVGVTAYSGAAPLITTPAYLTAAAGILAVEAYHAGLVRTTIFAADPTGSKGYQNITTKVSMARMALDGSTTLDDIGVGFQNVMLEGTGNLTASTVVDAQTGAPNYSKTYTRSTTQVLRIVTGMTTAPASGTKYQGVFFPSGLNGLFS